MNENQKPSMIGEFAGPVSNAPRTPAPAPATPAADTSGDEKLQAAIRELQRGDAPLTPEELANRYLEGLVEVGTTIDEARRIMDTMLFQNMYEETHSLRANFKITLRTRDYEDTQRMLRIAEAEAPRIPTHFQDIVARCNLAASLVSYHETVFARPVRDKFPTDAAYHDQRETEFQKRLQFILELPTPVIERMLNILHRFDRKLLAVFAEGAPQDF